jgi:transposase-like protein
MYERKSRLIGKQRAKMIEMFVAGATARAAAEITGVNRNTVRIFYQRLRQLPTTSLQEKWRWMRAALVESLKVNENGVPQAR